MDTGTHIVMGVALGGLATIDPVVAGDTTLAQAVLVGTIIGSQAPDIDTILKLKNNAVYIRHHRGMTHSIPAVLIWGLLISMTIFAFLPEISFTHLWLWTGLAVVIHVLVDIFNGYGTQAYRPFSHKWVAHGFINTFDSFIFVMHIIGIFAWILGANPAITWIIIYGIISLYYVKRYIDKRKIIKQIHHRFPETTDIVTTPTIRQNKWRVAITTDEHFYVGKVNNHELEIVDSFRKLPIPETDIMQIALKDKNVSAFLSFSPIHKWEVTEYDMFTEVRFIDLRYRSKGRYPFVAVVKIDKNKNITSSYTGWIFSEDKLQYKLTVKDLTI